MASPGSGMPIPGQQPTPAQIQAMQRQLVIDAEKHGMTVPQFIEFLKKKQLEAQIAQQKGGQQQQQQQQQQGQPQPITPGPPNPTALAVAKFLRSQDLKERTCVLNQQRKPMFKVKRALRALQSPAYAKARSKNPLLPEITDRASLENTFKLLPLSLLALRVSKVDPNEGHEGHNHAPPPKIKRVKGLWTVKIEQQQDCKEDLHYVWLYEGSQIKTKLYAAGALLVIFAIVLFPLWPMKMRLGVWYLSMGVLGLIGLFFAMSIVRLIIWGITAVVLPVPWLLFPNLFEDVGFWDSFKPVWVWDEKKKSKKKSKSTSAGGGSSGGGMGPIQVPGQPPPASVTTGAAAPQMTTSVPNHRNLTPRVEEVFDE